MQGLQLQCSRLQADWQAATTELELAKSSSIAGVKAGAAAVQAAQAQFASLQAELAAARPGSTDQPAQLALLRQDLQHLTLDVEHHEKTAAQKDAEIAQMLREVEYWRAEADVASRREREQVGQARHEATDVGVVGALHGDRGTSLLAAR